MRLPVALLILSRDPSGPATGRLGVLRTAAESLEALGYRVEVAAYARSPLPSAWRGWPLHSVPLPPIGRVAVSALGVLLFRQATFNEALYDGAKGRRVLGELTSKLEPELVVADGVRTAAVAMSLGLPTVVHLDDLLSDRYLHLANDGGRSGDMLGYYKSQLPNPLLPVAQLVAERILRMEARRLREREVDIARRASAVATTSQDEAVQLAIRSGVPVAALPMAVDVRSSHQPRDSESTSFVFLGSLDYRPNRLAIDWWLSKVRPVLDELGGGGVTLYVVGDQPRDVMRQLADERLQFVGYVDDLAEELARHRGMVVPVQFGAGVKTKVLDGFSVGIPVVATTAGASGTLAAPDTHYLKADTASTFAAAVLRLRDDARLAQTLGSAGRELVASEWSGESISARWANCLREAGIIPASKKA